MNYLKKHYRDWSENQNFLNESRFIYQGTPEAAPKAPKIEKPASQAPAEPLTPQEWDKHEKRFEKHMKVLEQSKPEKVKDLVKKFRERMGELKREYDEHATKLTKNPEELKKQAAEAVAGKVDTLITEIRGHIPEAARPPEPARREKSGAAPSETRKPGESDTKGEPGPEIKKEIPLENGREKAKEGLVKLLGKNWSQLMNLWKSFPGVDLGKPPTFENFKKEPITQRYLNYIINNLNPDQIKMLENGKLFPITEQFLDICQKALHVAMNMENFGDKDEAEIALIKELKLDGKSFEDIFGKDSKIPELLSRKYKIEKGKDEGIKIDGKDIKDIRQLKNYIVQNGDLSSNEEMKKQFDDVIQRKEGALKKFDKLASEQNESLIKVLQVQTATREYFMKLIKPEAGEKAPGAMEGLTLLLQLFAAIKKAFKDSDWASLNDFLSDWNKSKNPKELAKRVEESKKSYGEMLEKKAPAPDIDLLLKAYLKPRGDEADKLFGKTGPTSKYRGEAPPAIQNYLVGKLGLGRIASISELVNGRIQIEGYKTDGTHIAIEFYKEDGTQKAEFKLYKTVKEGDKEVEKKQETGRVIPDSTLANLKTEIGNTGKIVATPEPAPARAKPEAVKVAKAKPKRKGK